MAANSRSQYFLDLIKKIAQNPGYAFRRGSERIGSYIDPMSIPFRKKPGGIINEKELRVVGLKRTGNHAIINWIEKQSSGFVFHINNMRVSGNPYKALYRSLKGSPEDRDAWMAGELHRYPQYQGEEGLKRIKAEASGNFEKKDSLIISYEDYPINQIFNKRASLMHDYYMGPSNKIFNIIILRDPFNLFASRVKKGFHLVKGPKTLPEIWLDYAREFLGETNHLGETKICINYNKWVSDSKYRQELSDQLGFKFSDSGIDEVPNFGGGSSFDEVDFQGQATKMDVFSRWKQLLDNETFRGLFTNPLIFSYSEKIFGKLDGTEKLQQAD